jgi:mannose-6-phosphate isomerase-like protein (cupin superfamily)
MSDYRFRINEDGEWQSSAAGIRTKQRSVGAAGLRFVELLSTAYHPEWCNIGHSGCVVEGALEIEFPAETVRFEAGDGILIPPGESHKHRPRALTERVRLALVDHPG